MHKIYKKIDDIYRRAQQLKKFLKDFLPFGIPKAGAYPASFLCNLFDYNRILGINLIDTICDSGSTFSKFIEGLVHDKYITTAILTKEKSTFKPDITFFEVTGYEQDLWFYGFGMDLIPGSLIGLKSDPGRNFNCICYCEPEVVPDRIQEHPISQLLLRYKPELIDKLQRGNVIDFTLLFKPTHKLEKEEL